MTVTKRKLFTQLSDATESWLPTRGEPIVYHARRETRASQQDPRLAPQCLAEAPTKTAGYVTTISHSRRPRRLFRFPLSTFNLQLSTFSGNFLSSTLVSISKNRPSAGQQPSRYVRP